MIRQSALAVCMLALSDAAFAQCPDGSPPPCAPARRAQAQVPPPPAAAVRARRFLLLPFRNVTRTTEQDWLVTGAPLMLGQILGQFSDLEVVPEERLTAASRKLGINVASADAAQLRTLADETGGWTAISGDVFATGANLRISVRAMDIATSRVLVRADTVIAATVDPREAFDRLSVRLLKPAGVPPGASSLAAITTHSIDAFRAYAHGLDLYERSRFREAEAEFERAVRLDSSFALAWAAIAATSISAGGVQVITNPRSHAYRAIEHAVRHSIRLPPRETKFVRAVHALFRGEIRRARHQFDSLLAANPEDLDVAYWVAISQMLAAPVDTTVTPWRLQSSMQRSVRIAEMTLDRDPRRRTAHAAGWLPYALGAGLWWGDVYGHRREFPSFAMSLMAPPDVREVPVLRGDTLELMPRSAFDSLPVAEQARLRRRSAEAAWQWAERWLQAGPDDADTHLWASHSAELRGDYERALRELNIADSIGIQSVLDNLPGRRLSLLVLAGRYDAAGTMADSMLMAGTLTDSPFLRVFDRRRAYGAATLLVTKQFERAGRMALAMGSPQEPGCHSLRREMVGFRDAWIPRALRQAVMDTVSANLAVVNANPVLQPCADVLSKNLQP